jgi:hypothetical protein
MGVRFRSSVLAALIAFVVGFGAMGAQPASAKGVGAPPVSFARMVFTAGTSSGVTASSTSLTLSGTADGTWTSAPQPVLFPFDELVASWNATTPGGSWITVEMAASGSRRTTKWYTMGIWTTDVSPEHRTSVGGQADADGTVAIDTFIRAKKAAALDSYQLKVTLHAGTASPSVRFIGAMTSAATKYDIPSVPYGSTLRDSLGVPTYSQEIHTGEFPQYDGGGEAWCSPTSTAMILDFWHAGPSAAELAAFPGPTKPDGTPYVDPQVDYAAQAVFDWHYNGAGNWPFNAAYAGSRGLNAFVTRLRSLAEAELFIQAGIPLVASINGRLPGFFFGKTSGHLLTIVGFTATGDVISNDPAVPTDGEVHKIYGRADFENVWLGGSGGIVYVIYPNGTSLPTNVADLPSNW